MINSHGEKRRVNGNGKEGNSHSHRARSLSSSSYPPSSSRLSSSLFLPASINPDTFTPAIDIIWTISNDKEKYTGDKSLSMTQFPAMVRVNIDRLRPHMKGSPGVHPVVAACLFHGLVSLSNYQEIRDLIHLKNRFDMAPRNVPGIISTTLANFLSKYRIDTPVGERFNIFLPPNHHALLSRIGRDLGVNIQSLAVLSIIHTLSSQPHTNADNRREMEMVVKGFLEGCKVRVRGARALMEEFEIPEVEEMRIEELEEC